MSILYHTSDYKDLELPIIAQIIPVVIELLHYANSMAETATASVFIRKLLNATAKSYRKRDYQGENVEGKYFLSEIAL